MPLTARELELIHAIGFGEAICSEIKTIADKPFDRLSGIDGMGNAEPANGLSIIVADGGEAEHLMNTLRPILGPAGYRSFWSHRHAPNGMKEADELAILKTADPYAMVRLCRTDGANYDLSNDDILSRLASWEQICTFDVVGASRDWVALQFSRPPENVCAFAEEVFAFCPDTVSQGVGLAREKDDPERFRLARQLCPHISEAVNRRVLEPIERMASVDQELAERFRHLIRSGMKDSTSADMGVRLLAYDIRTRRFLFLWWD